MNPINEYQLGKPPADIYVQYGLGNTALMKLTMDLFGGLSIQNYYRTYLYYTIYGLSFLIMLMFVFRNGLYVLITFTVIPVCFLFMGYIAYILAPGIIPTIHLFDATVVVFLVLYLRSHTPFYLFGAILLSLSSIIINVQFGMALYVALLLALSLFFLENKEGTDRVRWLLVLCGSLFVSGFLVRASSVGLTKVTFPYFLAGLFSWRASSILIFGTTVYLVASYCFLLLLKHQRSHFKYLYVFVFVYSQALLVYYYWSGLSNHLPPVVPFIWFQVCLMVYMAQTLLWAHRPLVREVLHFSIAAVFALFCFGDSPCLNGQVLR